MVDIDILVKTLSKKGHRMTSARKSLLEVLENEHLTIKEIHRRMIDKGYENLMTIYNNLDFFIEENLVAEINIKGKKYYDLAIGSLKHGVKEHVHFTCDNSPEIIEMHLDDVLYSIKNHPAFGNYNLNKIHISISGKCKICIGEKCFRYSPPKKRS